MSYLHYAESVKNGSDDYVREQLYRFNLGGFDYLRGSDLYLNVMNVICDEMDRRGLW